MDILLGIFLFISLPAAYIIGKENAKIRSLVCGNSLPIINVRITESLSCEDRADLLSIACLIRFGDFYYTAGQYLKAFKFYRDIILILPSIYFRNNGYSTVFSVLHASAVDRIRRTLKKLFVSFKRTEELKKLGL